MNPRETEVDCYYEKLNYGSLVTGIKYTQVPNPPSKNKDLAIALKNRKQSAIERYIERPILFDLVN